MILGNGEFYRGIRQSRLSNFFFSNQRTRGSHWRPMFLIRLFLYHRRASTRKTIDKLRLRSL